MPVNPKRRKRVLLIAGVSLAIAAGVGGAYAFRQRQLDDRARAFRDNGRAALAARDYPAALEGLGRFLQRLEAREGTAKDLRDYALALRHQRQANDAQLHAAIGVLRKSLEKDPSCREAQDDLLELYAETGFGTEALDLLERMIAADPSDMGLVRQQRDWLEAQRKYKEALVVAKRVNAGDSNDFDGFVRTWSLLVRTEATPTEVVDWVDSVVSTHPQDTRFELLRSAELERRGEVDAATAILDRFLAAPIDSRDPKFVIFLVNRLDAADRFSDALGALAKLGGDVHPSLRIELCRRLWFARRLDEAAAGLERLTAGPEAESEALALRILVLRDLDRATEDEPARRAIAAHDDGPARAWQAFVKHVVDGKLSGGAADVAALRAAVSAVPTSALLHKALGDAQARLGETDAAIRSWRLASGLAKSWADPLISLAQALPASRAPEATACARAALARAPGSRAAISTFVEIMARNAADVSPSQLRIVVEGLDAMRSQAPGQTTDLIPAQVSLTLQMDRADAERRMRAVLADPANADEATLLRLARLAQGAGVPFGGEFLDVSERLHGVTPQLAVERALARAATGSAEAGLRVLDEMRSRRAATTSELDWDLVRAGFLDAAQLPEAGPAWIRISDAHPESRAAQLGALASNAVWADRDAVARTIERLRALTGDDGTTWRIARARWLIGGATVADADIDQAVVLLDQATRAAPTSAPARVLYAQALERLGKLQQALDQLLAAAELEPTNSWIALELARLAQRTGDPDLSLRQLERALRSADLPPEQTERAAYLLAVRGDAQRGADLLEPLATRAQMGRDGLLLLARLYAKLGHVERALAICDRLLAAPAADVITLAADLYASTGRFENADAVLARLDGLDLPSGDREAIRARHYVRWGTVAAASDAYVSALAAAPRRAELWTEYVAMLVAAGDTATVARLLDDPNFVQVEPVGYLKSIRELCTAALPDERLRPILAAAVNGAASRPILADAMRRVTEGWTDPARREDTARSVRTLADANPRLLPLQILAARLCTEVGDLRGAGEVAARAAASFPDSVEAAFRAFDSLARSARWDEALNAALKWRDRAARGDLGPEVAVARVRLRLDRPADAASGLEPYVAYALARPDVSEEFLITYAVTLVRAGKVSLASDMIRGLITASARWKALILDVQPSLLGGARESLAWLRMCAPLLPGEEFAGRMKLARAWGAAWETYRAPELLAGARSVLDDLVARPDSTPEAGYVLGTLLQQAGDADGARAAYASAIARDPRFAPALNNLAVLLADSGQWTQAVEQATLAIEVAPRRALYHDTLAYALRKGKAFERSIAASDAAVRLDPTNPEWLIGLAETQVLSGDTARGLATLDRVRTLESQGVVFTEALRARYVRLRESK